MTYCDTLKREMQPDEVFDAPNKNVRVRTGKRRRGLASTPFCAAQDGLIDMAVSGTDDTIANCGKCKLFIEMNRK